MLSFIKNFGMTFQAALPENCEELPDNPGRGFYRIYTFTPGVAVFEPPVRYPGESLALVLMDIGAFRERAMDEETVQEIRRILQAFTDLGFQMIVRFCYDTEGKGMVKEPSLFSLVKTHLSQVAGVIKPFAEDIFVYQGLLVGNWGEMHESKFLAPKYLQELIQLFLRETEGRIPLAIRKPVQLRQAFSESTFSQATDGKPIGFFNDGILGSQTHLGTFAPETAGRAAWQEMWGPAEEVGFMDPLTDRVPYGGEVLYPPEAVSPQEVISVLSRLRVSYLNSTHEARLLEEWKKTPFEGGTLYDHVEYNLGYAFTVQKTKISFRRKWECTVEVKNEGFGSLYEEAKILLWMEQGEQQTLLGTMTGGLQGMKCGEIRDFSLAFEGTKEPSALYASIQRTRDQRQIYFSQKSREGLVLLGRIQKGR